MSVYITFKHIDSEIEANGKKYTVVEFNTWYHPFDCISTDKGYKKPDEFDLSTLTLRHTPKIVNSEVHSDQFGNEWFENKDLIQFMAYCDGKPLTKEPTYYSTAAKAIADDAGINDLSIRYYSENRRFASGYRFLSKKNPWMDTSRGEYVKDFSSMFTPRFKVGDRVFYLEHRDRDTRNGERYQIVSFIVTHIRFNGNFWEYSDRDLTGGYRAWDKFTSEEEAAASVEELQQRHPYDKLYMWHHLGGCHIEECPSTKYFMRYLKQQEDN